MITFWLIFYFTVRQRKEREEIEKEKNVEKEEEIREEEQKIEEKVKERLGQEKFSQGKIS